MCAQSHFLHYAEHVWEPYYRPIAVCWTDLHKEAFLTTGFSEKGDCFYLKIPLRVIGVKGLDLWLWVTELAVEGVGVRRRACLCCCFVIGSMKIFTVR